MAGYYLCMAIGGTNLRYGVVDTDFTLLEFQKISTEYLSAAPDKGDYLASLLKPLIEKYGRENILCLALSLASLMDRDRTICYSSPNIRGFDNLPLKAVMESRLSVPVFMERDVNTELLYEIRRHGIDPAGVVVGVFIGTGLGNAMCIDGKVYRGSTGSSCELGHIPLEGMDRMCGCGKKGCIEMKACGRVLAELAEEKYHCPVAELFARHGSEEDVLDVVRLCAIATATEVAILDPVCVILGGGVVEMEGFPLAYFEQTVRNNLRIPEPRASLRLILSSGDPEAGVIGAAMNAETEAGLSFRPI